MTSTSNAIGSVCGAQFSSVQTANLNVPVNDFLPVSVAVKLITCGPPSAPEAAASVVGRGAEVPVLSEREIEVVRLLAEGHSNRAIAGVLFLAEATVKTHLVRIYRKLGTENRASTVSEAVRLGLIELV